MTSDIPRYGLTLRHLTFTGPGVEAAELRFEPGLNVVYGSSNTGKSWAARALDFMLGSSRAPRPLNESKGYAAGWLGLTLPDGRDVTLYRALRGGDLRLFEGLVKEGVAPAAGVLKLKHNHGSGDNVSTFLLNAVGIGTKWVVRSIETRKKHTISFRHVAPYVIVEESPIIDERSPILSGQRQDRTSECNVFKVLLSGEDDEAVVEAPDPKELKTLNIGRVQILEELIAQADVELGDAGRNREALGRQAETMRSSLAERTETLRIRQANLDEAVTRRRDRLDAIAMTTGIVNELLLTVRRYGSLEAVYHSDIARLEALEENSFLLKTIRGRECPTCGAPPGAHVHGPSAEDIDKFHRAADAEMRKIRREQTELRAVKDGLLAEAKGKIESVENLTDEVRELDRSIAGLRAAEASARNEHAEFLEISQSIERLMGIFARRDQYVVRVSQLQARSVGKSKQDKLKIGIDGIIGAEFAKVVEEVLIAWDFPDAPRVSWDEDTQDIKLDGKERAANGKGVRALLHAAFKVAMMIFCHRNELRHPGFILLDTPLLTYREPMAMPRHGELEADEETLKATSLDQRFYQHLASLAGIGQIIVLENSTPPRDVETYAKVTAFTKSKNPGQRYGFFPITN